MKKATKKQQHPEYSADLTPAGTDPSLEGAENQSPSLSDARQTTFKPNGGSSVVIAPEPSGVDLGPIVIDEGRAVATLQELAALNDRAIQAKKRYEDAKDRAKALKAKWDDLSDELQTLLREATHGSDTPLLDLAEGMTATITMVNVAPDGVLAVPADEVPF